MATMSRISPLLPWDRLPEEEGRFRKILLSLLIFLMLASVIITIVKLPAPPRVLKPALPERLVKLVVEQKEVPPPPVVEAPKIEEEKKPDVVEEKPPEQPTPDDSKVVEKPKADDAPPVDTVRKEKAKAEARKQFAAAGFDALADLRSSAAPSAKPAGTQNLVTNVAPAGFGDSAATQRSLIADRAKAGSGGVVTARASTDAGNGSGLAGSGTSRVVSGIGGIQTADVSSKPASVSGDKTNADKAKGRRPDENIQLAFDGAKGALQALYHRALRNAPDMKGRVVFRLTIEADGRVSACEIASSELGDAELERKLLTKVKQIDFGAMNVEVWKDTFRMDFFPS